MRCARRDVVPAVITFRRGRVCRLAVERTLMPSSRVLRCFSVLLVLFAGELSVVRSALGLTCARAGGSPTVLSLSRQPIGKIPESGGPSVPAADPIPASPSAHCTLSTAALPHPEGVPAAASVVGQVRPSSPPGVQPASHRPAPPFHPPRQG
jgi:hypothetical protein